MGCAQSGQLGCELSAVAATRAAADGRRRPVLTRSRGDAVRLGSARPGSRGWRRREGTAMTAERVGASGGPSGATVTRPMNGAEYLESLRDGREIWLYGERVQDVTTHPAFRNTARMVARLYDALHDPALKAVLTITTDTGSGGYTHRYFRALYTWEEQLAARDAIAAWARLTYGWMGRAPDYKGSFLGTLGANAAFYAPYESNARVWYKKA